MQPMSCRSDVGRTNMFCSHFSQTVVLDQPERPRVFSRFENKFGSYSTALRSIPAGTKIIGVFDKNALQRVFALEYPDGRAGIHFAQPARHLTETYGYMLDNSPLEGAGEDDVAEEDTVIQGWPCHDAEGNFQYGLNLKTVYMNMDGLTYEDGLIMSESAADRMSHTSVDRITVNLNANDLTVNYYGDAAVHQGFPEVGQKVKDGILLARRRINHESILFDLSTPQLCQINWESDMVFYSEGTVVDIDVYSNLSEEGLEKHPFNRQILEYHRNWLQFREWFFETFNPYIHGVKGSGYMSDVGFWLRSCKDSETQPWRHERTEFDGVVLRFTVVKRNPIKPGSKITNRYGGKGVISQIRPDKDMPMTEDGRRADLVVNSLGVVNRLNTSQLFESELNYLADHVVEQMAAMETLEDRKQHLLSFYGIVAKDQHQWMVENLSDDDWAEMIQEIIVGNEPIYIHQAPFFGVVSLEELRGAYEIFGVEKSKFVGIEEPMILGTNYYMKLRHEPSGKHSARSAKHLSIAGVPTKNSRGVRTNTEHHSTTPIRLGEQELQNLLIANKPDELKRMLRIYATDDVSREGAIADLLLRSDPFSDERIEPRGNGITRPVAGLKALLESVGLQLNISDEETENGEQQP